MMVKVNLITYWRISELLNVYDVGNLYSNRFMRVSVDWKTLSLIENKGKLISGVCCHQEIFLLGTESDLPGRLLEKKIRTGCFLSKL